MRRNTEFDETVLVDRAVGALRSRLPPTWGVDIDADAGYFDGLVTITNGPACSRFVVDAKTNTRLSSDQVINQLRSTAAIAPHPLLFVTEYINPSLRKRCEESAISYVDTTGWAYIVSNEPPIIIRLEGAAKPPRPSEPEATARLSGPASARAIRCLLEMNPPVKIRELATRSGSSPGAVSKLMPTLVDAGAVERSTDGTITRIRRRTLLNRWTADYSFLNSNGVVLDDVAPRGIPRTLDQLRALNVSDYCLTGSVAARTYLPQDTTSVLPLSLITVYAKDMRGMAERLKLVRTNRSTSNVMITTPRDRTLLECPRSRVSDLPAAPLGQALADLLTLPGRMAQEAEQLIDSLAENDPAWSE